MHLSLIRRLAKFMYISSIGITKDSYLKSTVNNDPAVINYWDVFHLPVKKHATVMT